MRAVSKSNPAMQASRRFVGEFRDGLIYNVIEIDILGGGGHSLGQKRWTIRAKIILIILNWVIGALFAAAPPLANASKYVYG